MACPHDIIAGNATAGLPGRGGEAPRAPWPTVLIHPVLGGAVTLITTG